MKARGSAIIIAMLLITAVGGIAFGISRVLFIEFASASYYVNGSVAYYAAESGMEEGFLRYRYSKNAEVPFDSWTLGDDSVYRSNLSDSASSNASAGIAPATAISDLNKQYYDLRMGYLGTFGGPFYGHNASSNVGDTGVFNSADLFASNYGTGDYDFAEIKQDNSEKFDLTNIDFLSQNLMLFLQFQNIDTNNLDRTSECQATAEVKFVVKDAVGIVNEYKGLTSFKPETCAGASYLNTSKSNLIAADSGFSAGGYVSSGGYSSGQSNADYYYLLGNIFNDMLLRAGKSPESNYQNVTMYVKPLFHDVKIAFVSDHCNTINSPCKNLTNSSKYIVAGPFTTISATGYYGGTSRKLEANIDRQSGTLYDLFDYVIYKNS
ncbi:MAG: pilus assembly PilX N-terminal domain-containing protein [Patescibacteria group bacterium]